MEFGHYLVCFLLVATTTLAVEEQVLLNFYNGLGMHRLFPARSCREIYKYNYASHAKSGDYWIQPSADGDPIKVYCDMELSCGGRDGGWMRIGSINNGDRCPTGWLQMTSPVKACRGTSDKAGCYPTYFNNTNLPYQHICGKVVGYQKGTSDAFYTFRYPSKSLDIPYVDGVSFTYSTPRKHLFTYANGFSYGTSHTRAKCPCVGGDNPPMFVRHHYFCESGTAGGPGHSTVYSTDLLWDGKGCETGNSCCSQAGTPWFYRDVLNQINEPIEARICRDQDYPDEGILIRDLELYIQ